MYGAGAVGLGVASCLSCAGVGVHLVARPGTVDALRRNGLLRTGVFGCHTVPPTELGLHVDIATLPAAAYDYIIISTKSFDTDRAARALTRLPGAADARHVLFQNGWGNVEAYTAHHTTERVFAARVITGFARPAPNVVQVTVRADDIHIGSFRPGCEGEVAPLAQASAQGGIPCTTTPHIVRDLWAKMLYSRALNPLGAVFEVTYGGLAASRESRRIMDGSIAEVFAVMRASGFRTHWSTLQDIRARKRTEIHALNGAVVHLAAQRAIAAPINALLPDMVLFKEGRGRMSPGPT